MPAIFDSQGSTFAVWASQAEPTPAAEVVAGTFANASVFGAASVGATFPSPVAEVIAGTFTNAPIFGFVQLAATYPPPTPTPTTMQPILLTISLTGQLLILAPIASPADAPPTLTALTLAGALVIAG